jgi:hypothetical protein
MTIDRSIDVEEAIRASLGDYMQVYVKPLPKTFEVPSVEIAAVGGSEMDKIDRFDVTLDSRAEVEAEALENLRNAIGIIKKVAKSQTTALRVVTVNSLGSWGKDPVRPDLAMYSARLRVIAHVETVEV